ncbi:hypothetical protein V2J09_013644 [Rumex salicifolius]
MEGDEESGADDGFPLLANALESTQCFDFLIRDYNPSRRVDERQETSEVKKITLRSFRYENQQNAHTISLIITKLFVSPNTSVNCVQQIPSECNFEGCISGSPCCIKRLTMIPSSFVGKDHAEFVGVDKQELEPRWTYHPCKISHFLYASVYHGVFACPSKNLL